MLAQVGRLNGDEQRFGMYPIPRLSGKDFAFLPVHLPRRLAVNIGSLQPIAVWEFRLTPSRFERFTRKPAGK